VRRRPFGGIYPALATLATSAVVAVLVGAFLAGGPAAEVLGGALPAGALTVAPRFPGAGVEGYGDAANLGGPGPLALAAPEVALAATPDDHGYWIATADGGVLTYGDAGYFGSLGSVALYAPIVGMATTADGGGYWLVAMDGGVFGFGDAAYYGSLGATPPTHPIVAITATPDGHGYWLVGSDGAVYPYGDAVGYGSLAGRHLGSPIVAMAVTPDGQGYWLAGSGGGVFAFGDAGYFGSAAKLPINTWITGLAVTPDAKGYWLVAATGGVLTFGDAAFEGPSPNKPPFSPTIAVAATRDGGGYWLLRQDEAVNAFQQRGPTGGFSAGARAVAVAATQVGPDFESGPGRLYCNPYGPCEQWCALFATWVWETAGIPIPRFPFTGSVVSWSARHGRVIGVGGHPVAGDGVMYGTGPGSAASSVHMGIVAQVWPDGAIDTVEGDAGPEPAGQYAVIVNGPFLPAQSAAFNGMPIYAFVQP
jgi:hypothetical protein